MNNFNFHNPTRLLFGKGQIAAMHPYIPAGVKIMVTYGGGSIRKNGVYDQVMATLKGFEVVEFGGIEPNPLFETLMQAVELARKENVTFLLAVGGGSVLDGTKFIAAAIPYTHGDPWDILAKGTRDIQSTVPLGAVLTLPATGSEMNMFAVISRKSTQEKYGFGHPALFPVFSVLDPTTTFSLPARQIANGVADAFTHVMEQYMTYPAHAPLQDRMAESVLLTLIEEGYKTLNDPSDYDARANFCWCATMALNGVIGVGVPQDWATHSIGHELTAFHGIDHGRTLAAVLPHLLWVKRNEKKDKLLQYGTRVWKITDGTDEERIARAIHKTVQFYESLGIATKASAYGVTKDTVDKIVERFKQRNLVLGERRDITPEVVEEILTLSIS